MSNYIIKFDGEIWDKRIAYNLQDIANFAYSAGLRMGKNIFEIYSEDGEWLFTSDI